MPGLVTYGLLAALQTQPESMASADMWTSYSRELPAGARVAAIHTVEPGGEVVVFFSLSEPSKDGATNAWFALRDERSGGEEAGRVWLKGADCPALYGVLDWLSEIVIPSVWTGVRELPAPSVFMRPLPSREVHGSRHTIEGYGWTPDADSARVTMSSSAGLLAQWGTTAKDQLRPCWSAEQPSELISSAADQEDIANVGPRRRDPTDDFPGRP